MSHATSGRLTASQRRVTGVGLWDHPDEEVDREEDGEDLVLGAAARRGLEGSGMTMSPPPAS